MSTDSFLTRMASASRARASVARARETEARLLERALAAPAPPALRMGTFDIVAELKLRSPAAGPLAGKAFNRAQQLERYAQAGAAAVSVLTEPDEFAGELAHLTEAAERLRPLDCPVMRKDFLTDPYQVLEARAAGAAGVLLIVAMLSDGELRELADCAARLGLFVLLEAFDREDVERIGSLGLTGDGVLAGVNCRNLKSLDVNPARFEQLAAYLPLELPVVAESGIATPDDVREVARLGYRLALVGSALMRASDPAAALRELLIAGRETAAPARG